jgi:RNA polymerase sigma-70 factor, ECF subfamily
MADEAEIPKESVSDERLVIFAVNGDRRSFEILVRRHQEKAVQIAYSFIHNFHDAKDIAQDAFVKSFKSLYRFQQRSKFSTWFYRILINQCKDFLKRKKEFTSSNESIFENIASPTQTDDAFKAHQLKQTLMEALNSLTFKQKAIVILSYFEEHSLEEVSTILGISIGTVKATRFQVLAKLKKELITSKEKAS